MITAAMVVTANPMKRYSMGNIACSAAYFTRNTPPRNEIATAANAIGLRVLSQFQKRCACNSNALGGGGTYARRVMLAADAEELVVVACDDDCCGEGVEVGDGCDTSLQSASD